MRDESRLPQHADQGAAVDAHRRPFRQRLSPDRTWALADRRPGAAAGVGRCVGPRRRPLTIHGARCPERYAAGSGTESLMPSRSRSRRRRLRRRLIATPPSANAPPTNPSTVGTSPRKIHDNRIAMAGTANVVAAIFPASVRFSAYAHRRNAIAVGPMPRKTTQANAAGGALAISSTA